MTKQEFSRIVAIIRTFYSDSNMFMTKDEVLLWFDMFDDKDFTLTEAAVKTWVATHDKPPKVSNLLDTYNSLIGGGNDLTEAEAWGIVNRAIHRGIDYAEEDFERFPDVIKKAVGSPGQIRRWAQDEYFNEGVESSNFKRVYRTEIERSKRDALIPADVKAITGKIVAQLEAKRAISD